jgi:ligand-binding sensor domain-containing protein
MEDGLPHTIVQSILQTRDGYLWVGTREGLARFDGHSFLCLAAREFGTGLVQPSVVCLCETRDGSLWIGTENGGLFRLYQGRLVRFGVAEGLRGSIISGLQETPDGTLWVAASGLARYRNGQLNYPFDQQVGRGVASLFLDPQGVLWVNASSGVRQLRGDQLTLFRLADDHPLGPQRSLACDRHGTVWGGQTGQLLEVRDGKVKPYPKAPGAAGIIGALLPDREGNLWVGSYAGISRFVDGEFVSEKDERGESYRVFCFLQDREGNVWCGSEEGLVRLTPQQFTTYTKKDGLSADSIAAVCADHGGGVWVSVWGGGLNHFVNGTFNVFGRTNGLSSDFVLAVHEARDGSLWVGADYGSGLNHLRNGQVAHYKVDPVFTALLEDEQGRLWIGSRDSLTCLKDGKFQRYTMREGLNGNQINALCLGQGGVLWVGTQAGLSRWRENHFENVAPREPKLQTIILSLYEDAELSLGAPFGMG